MDRWTREADGSAGGKLAVRMKEAAQALSVSERTLHSIIKRGEIRVVRLSNGPRAGVLIPARELERYLRERCGNGAQADAEADERADA